MSHLEFDISERVLTITLNRPEKLNALSPQMREALIRVLEKQSEQLDCGAIVIRGRGRGFCTGADIQADKILARRKTIGSQVESGINRIIQLITSLPVPVIAAVNGPAAGAGVSLALASDIMLANRDATFHLSFSRIGAVMDGGSSWFLARAIGTRRTAALALTGGVFNAEQALAWGLAHQVTNNEQLWDCASALAQQLAAGPTRALGLIKREVAMAAELSLNDALRFEAECQQTAFNTGDFAEAIRARQEQREPLFSGS